MLRTRRASAARVAAVCAAAAATAALALHSRADAQTTIAYSGGTYGQDCDTLPSAGTFAFVGNGPFDLSAAPVGASNMAGWSFAKVAGSGANASFIVSPGTSTTGGAYSFGAAGEVDRALGSIASGTNASAFGATFVNTGSIALNSFTINFTMEQWRNGGSGNANTLSFEYGLGASDLVSGTFVASTSLDAISVVNAAGGGSLNGNLPANQQAVSGTVSGLNWAPGQALVVRWRDNDEGGADSGVGIDGFSFSAAGGAKNLVWNPAGTGGTNWSTSPANTNWLDGPTPSSFANGDIANFTNSGVGSVNVDAGGVGPGGINVSSTSGTYTLAGGPIGGSAALVKTGDGGTLVIATSNSFTGGTTIGGGTVVISNNANLGAANTAVAFSGGALRVTSNLSSTRALTFAADTTSTLDVTAASVTFGGASGAGSLRKTGTGTVSINGAYNIDGTTTPAAGVLRLGQSTGSINLAAPDSGGWTGHLLVAEGVRVNFNSGSFSGGGQILFRTTGSAISTTGALVGQTPVIGNVIHLNHTNAPQPYVTTIGATAQNTLTLNGVVDGASDVIFSSSTAGAGTGIVVLGAANLWTGVTTISNATAGVVRLGTNNALPATTHLVFGTGTFNAGAVDLAGFNQFVRSLASDTTGVVNGIANTGGTTSMLVITGSATTTFAGTIGVPLEVTNLPGANANIALLLVPPHTGQLTLAAANNYAGGTTVGAGTLVAAHAEALGAGSVNVTGGTLRLAPGLGAPVRVPLLAVSGTGRADITDNAVVIDYDTTSPLTNVRDDIAGAYAGGSWNGSGITSSNANATQLGVGYGEASALTSVPAVFGTVDSTAVLLRLTRYGDANLDGQVNLQDFNRLASNFGLTGSGLWTQGDFNYDGNVNLQDFNRLASNFGQSAAGPQVTPHDWAALAAAVPEPGVTFALGLIPLGAGRRRRSKLPASTCHPRAGRG